VEPIRWKTLNVFVIIAIKEKEIQCQMMQPYNKSLLILSFLWISIACFLDDILYVKAGLFCLSMGAGYFLLLILNLTTEDLFNK
jgi:hypothetical protein